jgi:hypothetical protein
MRRLAFIVTVLLCLAAAGGAAEARATAAQVHAHRVAHVRARRSHAHHGRTRRRHARRTRRGVRAQPKRTKAGAHPTATRTTAPTGTSSPTAGPSQTPAPTATAASATPTPPSTTSTAPTAGTTTPAPTAGTTAPAPTAEPSSTGTASAPDTDPQPVGDASGWQLSFDDEFNESSLDTSKWVALNGWSINDMTTSASNVSVSGGDLILTLRSSDSGAEIDSSPDDGAGSGGYLLPVGGFAEARIDFPGSGTTVDNWPAWWISGPDWPNAGENDVAEGLGTLTVNYHSPLGTFNQGTVPGTWTNGFHTYGIYRGAGYCDVYYDGVLVKSYTTSDDSQPEALLLTLGAANTPVYGAASDVKVDYVRAWVPAGS